MSGWHDTVREAYDDVRRVEDEFRLLFDPHASRGMTMPSRDDLDDYVAALRRAADAFETSKVLLPRRDAAARGRGSMVESDYAWGVCDHARPEEGETASAIYVCHAAGHRVGFAPFVGPPSECPTCRLEGQAEKDRPGGFNDEAGA